MQVDPQRRRWLAGITAWPALALVDSSIDPLHGNPVMSTSIVSSSPSSEATRQGFVQALVADAASPELGAAAEDFGWLIGGWRAQVRDIDADGRERTGRGEWWFAWVLEGRALQDVWISPPRDERAAPRREDSANDRYGTTIRHLRPQRDGWRIVWINPVSGAENRLAGRRDGDRIVLLGMDGDRVMRWRFVDIRPDAFTWQGHRLADDGERWILEAEFRLTRIAG